MRDVRPSMEQLAGYGFLELDSDYLQTQLLPTLIAQHFGTTELAHYHVAAMLEPHQQTFFATDANAILVSFDAQETLFQNEAKAWRDVAPASPDTLVLRAQHKAGSLQAVMVRTRWRNLALGYSVLLLFASAPVLLIATQRARALAQRQMEFVAGVTHELCTPLTAIQSAGFNLSSGRVNDAERVKQYGTMIHTEGRRLADLIDQVLSYAHIEANGKSGDSAYNFQSLQVEEVIEQALQEYQSEFAPWGIEKSIEADLPPIKADAKVLGSAHQWRSTNHRRRSRSRHCAPPFAAHLRAVLSRAKNGRVGGAGYGLGLEFGTRIYESASRSFRCRQRHGVHVASADPRDERKTCMNITKRRILLVEDEPSLVMTRGDLLASEGHQVRTISDGQEGFEIACRHDFELLILDVMLPNKNGFDICREVRARGIQTPILMLTARGQIIDKVLGLKLGADDYLTKPFDAMELLARVEALLRRSTTSSAAKLPETFRFGNVIVDFRRTQVKRNGQRVELSAREFELLRYFIQQCDVTLSRQQLLRDVWGYDEEAMTRTIDVHIGALRQKLEDDAQQPRFFLTVRGLGYKFVEQGE